LRYPSSAARQSLIATHLPRLGQRWFFVDAPTGVEVVVLDARADLAAWLDACRAAGVIDAAAYVGAPLALEPRLFFGRPAPAFYVGALAIGSARAARVLGARAACVADQAIVGEIGALYASLFPRVVERHHALEHYATWLEQLADTTGAAVDCRPVGVMDDEYAQLRASMRRQTARLARHASVSLGADFEHTRSVVRHALVARLAHTQVVRLRGPDRAADLRWEVDLARAVAGVAPGFG
jgi:hypothetical protein